MRKAAARAALAILLASAVATPLSSEAARPSERDAAVLAHLREHLGPPNPAIEADSPARVRIAWTDLNADGEPEAFAYVTGRARCGSGGCKLVILQRSGATWLVRADTTVTRLPIGVLNTRSNGWRDVQVQVAGGGAKPRAAVLVFDGLRYQANPTLAPAPPADTSFDRLDLEGEGSALYW